MLRISSRPTRLSWLATVASSRPTQAGGELKPSSPLNTLFFSCGIWRSGILAHRRAGREKTIVRLSIIQAIRAIQIRRHPGEAFQLWQTAGGFVGFARVNLYC